MGQSNSLSEGSVFFRQWLRSPKSMGSVIPSSSILARAIAKEVAWRPGQHIVELGGGTGSITQGLLDQGIPADNLVVIELDTSLFEYLRDRFRGVNVIQGDATRLDEILPRLGVKEVGTVISGLPMVGTPVSFQKAIVEQGLGVVAKGGWLLQYSYSPVVSPIAAKKLGIKAEMRRYVLRNFPPAAVWRYTKSTT